MIPNSLISEFFLTAESENSNCSKNAVRCCLLSTHTSAHEFLGPEEEKKLLISQYWLVLDFIYQFNH